MWHRKFITDSRQGVAWEKTHSLLIGILLDKCIVAAVTVIMFLEQLPVEEFVSSILLSIPQGLLKHQLGQTLSPNKVGRQLNRMSLLYLVRSSIDCLFEDNYVKSNSHEVVRSLFVLFCFELFLFCFDLLLLLSFFVFFFSSVYLFFLAKQNVFLWIW